MQVTSDRRDLSKYIRFSPWKNNKGSVILGGSNVKKTNFEPAHCYTLPRNVHFSLLHAPRPPSPTTSPPSNQLTLANTHLTTCLPGTLLDNDTQNGSSGRVKLGRGREGVVMGYADVQHPPPSWIVTSTPG